MISGYAILAFLPLVLLACFFLYKFVFSKLIGRYTQNSKIGKAIDSGAAIVDGEDDSLLHEIGDEIDEIAEKAMSSVEGAKVIVFDSIYTSSVFIQGLGKTFLHYVMHYFVIMMRLLRDFSDWVYVKSRDRFVETAAKERKSVRRFWKHLKEYKKESDQEE